MVLLHIVLHPDKSSLFSTISFFYQVEKIVLFLLMQQGQLASRLSQLADVREAAEDSEQGIGATQTAALQQAYESVGKDLLKLLQFVDMNATGLRKILKKFDKHVGYRLTDKYVTSRSNHPYSQLQHIFRHVVSFTYLSLLLLDLLMKFQ